MTKPDRNELMSGLDKAIDALNKIPIRIIENEIPATNGLRLKDIHRLLIRERMIISALPHELGNIDEDY